MRLPHWIRHDWSPWQTAFGEVETFGRPQSVVMRAKVCLTCQKLKTKYLL